jgi:hypothetical protein
MRAQRRATAKITFWLKEDGSLMRYNDLRNAAKDGMSAAGIVNPKPSQLKYATVTDLKRANLPEEDIVAYVRHKPNTKTWKSHYLDTSSTNKSLKALISLKQMCRWHDGK